jgi:hypothetical protein
MPDPEYPKDFVASCENCRLEKSCKYLKKEIKHPDAQDNINAYLIEKHGSCRDYHSIYAPKNPEQMQTKSSRRRTA